MGLPTTVEAVVIIALLFVPGVVFGLMIRRAIVNFPENVDFRHVLTMGAQGLMLHAFAFPVGTIAVLDWYRAGALRDHWGWVWIWFIWIVFLWPVIAGYAIQWVVRRDWVDRRLLDPIGLGFVDRTPSAWDFAIRDETDKHITVHFRDGRPPVGGYYGQRSFGSIYASKDDIYLEQAHVLDGDGNFFAHVPNTAGLWVNLDAASHVEFRIGEPNGTTITSGANTAAAGHLDFDERETGQWQTRNPAEANDRPEPASEAPGSTENS